MENKNFMRSLFSVWKCIIYACIISLCVTICAFMFFRGLDIPQQRINHIAPLVFLNIIFLSFIFTILDGVKKCYLVERPLKQIRDATKCITKGEFSARIQTEEYYKYSKGIQEIIENFNNMAQELEGTETLRTDFISNVSHELKTPLSVIQNYTTLLQMEDLSEKTRREYVSTIFLASKRLSDLITNILKMNKLENQQIYPDRQRYNLGEQLCECMIGFEDLWEKKHLQIETKIEEDVIIEADRELMMLVWNNLLSNAIKFTENYGVIEITVAAKEKQVIVQVKDSGCGIKPEMGKHIFDKFYQGDTSHATEGNGLGLALVKRVIDIIDGEISVESILGEGSIFTVKMAKEAVKDGKQE